MIGFNVPYMTGRELHYIAQAHANGRLAGDGPFTRQCEDWLRTEIGTKRALLTHSCTAALEMAVMLAALKPGDEVIMPSFTFVSTANAVVLHGGRPVFVDIRPDTMNLDERQLADAVGPRTRAMIPVHYAGVPCDMDAIMQIAQQHDLIVIEDAAQAIGSSYRGRAAGSIGHFGAMSFHETKNVISGEGGALFVNAPEQLDRAEIIREKGTDRARFFRGQVDKYTWRDVGSSFLPGEVVAAFLWAQLQEAKAICARRMAMWQRYHDALAPFETRGLIRRPHVPDTVRHNGHLYYLVLPTAEARERFIGLMAERDIQCVFHYVPLHDSPMGRRVARMAGDLAQTTSMSSRLVRLPLWLGLEPLQQRVIDAVSECVERC